MLAWIDGSNCPPICTTGGWIVHLAALASTVGLITTIGYFAFRKFSRA